MKAIIITREIPAASALHARVASSDFHDCYSVPVADTSRTALGIFLHSVARPPSWVSTLMAIRNRLVVLVGLKNLGHLSKVRTDKPEHAYVRGDRVGIFTMVSNTPDEVVLEDRDKHLDVMLSILKLPADADGAHWIAVSTVVHIHNALGRLYMIPVAPIHKRIVPAVMARAADQSGL